MEKQSKEEFTEMIADYMEKGFLDNIIDMFRYDDSLYWMIPRLLTDERIRVRIGAVALVEGLVEIGFGRLRETADVIVPLLKDPKSYLRGDSAYCIGVIGVIEHIDYLKELYNDPQADVVESAKDAVNEITNRHKLIN